MDLPTRLERTVQCKQGAVRAVRYNVDGNYCMTCGSDKSVKLWNAGKGLLLKTYQGHGYEVLDACSSSDNAQIASGGLDKIVIVWDVETGKPVRKYRDHAGRVNAVAFNEESTVVFSASLDGSVRAWDCRSRATKSIQDLTEATDSVTSLTVSDHEVLSGSADCRARRYDLRQGQMYTDYVGKAITSVSFTRDGQCTLISTMDSTVRLLDKDNGELLADFKGHTCQEYKIDSCLLKTDAHVFSGSENGAAYGWDLVEGKQVCMLKHPVNHVVHSLSAHPTEQQLLTACSGSVYLWQPVDFDNE